MVILRHFKYPSCSLWDESFSNRLICFSWFVWSRATPKPPVVCRVQCVWVIWWDPANGLRHEIVRFVGALFVVDLWDWVWFMFTVRTPLKVGEEVFMIGWLVAASRGIRIRFIRTGVLMIDEILHFGGTTWENHITIH